MDALGLAKVSKYGMKSAQIMKIQPMFMDQYTL